MIVAELNQSCLKGGQRFPVVRLEALLRACSRALAVKKRVVVSIGFVSEGEMRRLNKTWRGKDRTTDVLAFPLDDAFLKGEVLINYEQARRQARQMGHCTRDELSLLIIHGVLHIFGYDHEKPKDAKEMWRLQEKILNPFRIHLVYG